MRLKVSDYRLSAVAIWLIEELVYIYRDNDRLPGPFDLGVSSNFHQVTLDLYDRAIWVEMPEKKTPAGVAVYDFNEAKAIGERALSANFAALAHQGKAHSKSIQPVYHQIQA